MLSLYEHWPDAPLAMMMAVAPGAVVGALQSGAAFWRHPPPDVNAGRASLQPRLSLQAACALSSCSVAVVACRAKRRQLRKPQRALAAVGKVNEQLEADGPKGIPQYEVHPGTPQVPANIFDGGDAGPVPDNSHLDSVEAFKARIGKALPDLLQLEGATEQETERSPEEAALWDSLVEEMRDSFLEELKDELLDEKWESIRAELAPPVRMKFREELEDSVRRSLKREFYSTIVDDELRNGLLQDLHEDFDSEDWEALGDEEEDAEKDEDEDDDDDDGASPAPAAEASLKVGDAEEVSSLRADVKAYLRRELTERAWRELGDEIEQDVAEELGSTKKPSGRRTSPPSRRSYPGEEARGQQGRRLKSARTRHKGTAHPLVV